MPSIESKPLWRPARLGAWVGAALVLCGCHYTEASRWAACCSMGVYRGKEVNTASANAILGLIWDVRFDPDGPARMRMDPKSSRPTTKEVILSAMNKFMSARSKSPPSDYFVELGMGCRPTAASATLDVTRCEIEVPIHVQCFSTNASEPWGSPLPDELQKPLPARLRLQADVSRTALLDVDVRVLPVPGGRL
jgi:hypothetical protein